MALPSSLLGLFKPRMLYLLAGMYATGHYDNINDTYFRTDVTIQQLSSITQDTTTYIEESLYPKIRTLKSSNIKWEGVYYTHTSQHRITKRNIFLLQKPTVNFRIINNGIFYDRRFTPEEKGYIIALYMLCVNNTFRFDLSNSEIARRIGVSLNTWKKFREILETKGVICSFGNAPSALVDLNFENSLVLNYEYLGYRSPSMIQLEAEIKDRETLNEIEIAQEEWKNNI